MPEVEAHTDTALPRRIGLISAYETFFNRVNRVECDGLTDEETETVKQAFVSRNAWRLRNADKLLCSELVPIVVAYRHKHPFPPPCTVHFEPTPLRDTDRTLQDLADHICEDADPSLHNMLDRKPTLSRFVRAKFAPFAACLLIVLVMHGRDWLAGASLIGIMLVLGFSLLLPATNLVLSYFKERRDWYLVPGGVVVRNASGNGPADLHVYSPTNTNIYITASTVSLQDRNANRSVRASCTPLEIAVLLAVWQSPIPAPDVSKLVDLQ